MKTLFLATTAFAVLAAAPALAQSGPVGSIGATYANTEVEFSGVDFDSDSYTVDGVVAVDAFQGWTATFAGAISHDDEANDTAFAGTAHLTRMSGSNVRLGGFVGAADVADETVYSIGAEVQKYLASATLTGSFAYTSVDDVDVEALTIGGDAAFYVTQNLRLNAGASYSDIESAGFDADLVTYGVGAEYEISNTPFSVAAGFNRGDIEDIKIDTWSIGLRYSFGGGLQARDRAGATLSNTGVASILGAL